MCIIEAQGVCKFYDGHTALNNIDLCVPHNSIYGLLGPNGAGKTSFIRIINQITAPDKGRVLFDGQPLKPKHVSLIGYLPEERGLYKKMKVGEQSLYLARLKGMTESEAKAQLKYWFEKFEITTWWDKKIEELSKGMAQKVQFITTVLHRPKLLIFDEPFTGFDPINTNLIKNEIRELRQNGATVIFSTHRMESVEEICDHIALINKSEKILEGQLREIRKRYRSNTFHITLETMGTDPTENLPKGFELKGKRHDDFWHIDIEINNTQSPNDVVSHFLQKGTVHYFKEDLPSVNDIFIQEVQKQ